MQNIQNIQLNLVKASQPRQGAGVNRQGESFRDTMKKAVMADNSRTEKNVSGSLTARNFTNTQQTNTTKENQTENSGVVTDDIQGNMSTNQVDNTDFKVSDKEETDIIDFLTSIFGKDSVIFLGLFNDKGEKITSDEDILKALKVQLDDDGAKLGAQMLMDFLAVNPQISLDGLAQKIQTDGLTESFRSQTTPEVAVSMLLSEMQSHKEITIPREVAQIVNEIMADNKSVLSKPNTINEYINLQNLNQGKGEEEKLQQTLQTITAQPRTPQQILLSQQQAQQLQLSKQQTALPEEQSVIQQAVALVQQPSVKQTPQSEQLQPTKPDVQSLQQPTQVQTQQIVNPGAKEKVQPIETQTQQRDSLEMVDAMSDTQTVIEPQSQRNLMEAMMGLRQAVQSSSRVATQSAELSTEKPLDVEKLQKEVDNGSFMQNTANPIYRSNVTNVKAPETLNMTPEATELLRQVKTGIISGLNEGRNEFVMKLKPEGLGELTVRLVEEGAKMTLSISAANVQTQKALSNNLAALQETMKPMNVEVLPVTAQQDSQSAANNFSMQNGLTQQNFAEHQHNGQSADNGRYAYQAQENDDMSEAQASVWSRRADGSEALNTYI